MNVFPQKISELPALETLDVADSLPIIDKSDIATSASGKTKQVLFSQIKNNILNSVVIPKASSETIGGVKIGSGLIIGQTGELNAEFSGSYNDLTDKPTEIGRIGDLSDLNLGVPEDGQAIIYNAPSESWVNGRVSYASLSNIPTNIVLDNSVATLQSLTITDNLIVTGTTVSNNFETLNVGTSEIVLNDELGKFTGDAEPGSNVISNLDSLFGLVVGRAVTISSNDGGLTLPAGTVISEINTPAEVVLSQQFQGGAPTTDVVFDIDVSPISNASVIVNRSFSPDAEIRWDEQAERWKFTNDGVSFYTIPTPEEYSNIEGLEEQLNIPRVLSDLSDVSNTGATEGSVLTWISNAWVPSVNGGGGGASEIGDLSDVDMSSAPSIGQVLKWTGTSWKPGTDLFGESTGVDGAITTPSQTSSIIPFYHATIDALPSATTYEGAVGYTKSGGKLYYAHDGNWLELGLASNIQSDTTYTLSTSIISTGTLAGTDIDYSQSTIKLTPSSGVASQFYLRATGGATLTRITGSTTNTLNIDSRTYDILAEAADGDNDTKLTLRGSDNEKDTILLQGADGLSVELGEDDSTIIFRAPSNVTQYTDNDAKDAMASAITSGTHVGITWTYSSTNKTLSSVVSGGGGGGGTTVLYDLSVTSATSNEALVSLSNSLDSNTDDFTLKGSNGTTVTWDAVEKDIIIDSTAPVQSDWNETDNTSLAYIANKPTIPSQYTLPTSSTTVLGGVKVDGSTIEIDQNGVISAASGGYVLPTASATVLGGIKIGSGLAIDEVTGVVTVSAGGGTPLQTRQTFTSTTGSISSNAYQELTIDMYKAYSLFKIITNKDAWVRVYSSQAAMIADRTRSEGADPGPGSGVIAESRNNGETLITPGTIGFNSETPISTNVYVSVTNRESTSQAISISLVSLRLEA